MMTENQEKINDASDQIDALLEQAFGYRVPFVLVAATRGEGIGASNMDAEGGYLLLQTAYQQASAQRTGQELPQ